mgnify:CR=1 FL=1
MSKHTPAPWSIDECTGHIIPSSGVGGGICDPWGDSIEQMEANARLIAAAPELLEACKNIVAACELTDDAYYDAIDTAINIARAAIAKAEGGAS